jgi:hypothetical protein
MIVYIFECVPIMTLPPTWLGWDVVAYAMRAGEMGEAGKYLVNQSKRFPLRNLNWSIVTRDRAPRQVEVGRRALRVPPIVDATQRLEVSPPLAVGVRL